MGSLPHHKETPEVTNVLSTQGLTHCAATSLLWRLWDIRFFLQCHFNSYSEKEVSTSPDTVLQDSIVSINSLNWFLFLLYLWPLGLACCSALFIQSLGLYELSIKIIPLEGKICDKEFQYLCIFFSLLSLVAHSRTWIIIKLCTISLCFAWWTSLKEEKKKTRLLSTWLYL